MAIKRRHTQNTSPYIYLDLKTGHRVVKTPATCTAWPIDFRMRVIADYLKPDTRMNMRSFYQKYLYKGVQSIVYKVERKPTLVINPYEEDGPQFTRVIGTYVVDLKNKVAVKLEDEEPAIRILTVLSFLTDRDIPGLPQYEVSPFSETDVPT